MSRILMVVRPAGGGAFAHVARLSRQLVDCGYEVAICGPHSDLSDSWVEVIPLSISRAVSGRGDVRAVRQLAAIYKRWQPDLIHAHGSKGGILARLARYGRPAVPLIHTPHGYAFSLQVVGASRKAAYRGLERAVAPLTTRVLAVCQYEARLAAGLGLASRTTVVHNGIEPLPETLPNPLMAELRERGPVVGVVSELHPRKGSLTFIDSVPALLERFPTASVVWAGEGPDRFPVEARISELGLAPAVHLVGLVDDIGGILFGSDVYVSPSWAESFPYSVLEAMSAARPIVATDVGGVGEAIENGVTGRLVPARDPVALADAVAELLAKPDWGQSLGNSARQRVAADFSFSGMVEGTRAVYGELGV